MGVECYKIEQRKGRKEYICQLCGEKIRKGLEYICESGRYDGEFFEHKRHIHCDALFNAYFDDGGDPEYTEDEIYEFVRETCCSCQLWHDDECEASPWTCPVVLEKRLDEQAARAAKQSIEENREDGI